MKKVPATGAAGTLMVLLVVGANLDAVIIGCAFDALFDDLDFVSDSIGEPLGCPLGTFFNISTIQCQCVDVFS